MSKKPLTQTATMPPSFFDTDMDKWNKKFESTVRDRKNKANENIKRTFMQSMMGTKDSIGKKVLQRRNSRMSKFSFNDVDFEYLGNTSNVSANASNA